jgi:hypothetical protein
MSLKGKSKRAKKKSNSKPGKKAPFIPSKE